MAEDVSELISIVLMKKVWETLGIMSVKICKEKLRLFSKPYGFFLCTIIQDKIPWNCIDFV
jgi:hypothetical protein